MRMVRGGPSGPGFVAFTAMFVHAHSLFLMLVQTRPCVLGKNNLLPAFPRQVGYGKTSDAPSFGGSQERSLATVERGLVSIAELGGRLP